LNALDLLSENRLGDNPTIQIKNVDFECSPSNPYNNMSGSREIPQFVLGNSGNSSRCKQLCELYSLKAFAFSIGAYEIGKFFRDEKLAKGV
jgi:hypothetical protein